jgi:hypothetical protein
MTPRLDSVHMLVVARIATVQYSSSYYLFVQVQALELLVQ